MFYRIHRLKLLTYNRLWYPFGSLPGVRASNHQDSGHPCLLNKPSIKRKLFCQTPTGALT
ncbi:hypothetical protein EGR_01104 [Echinococcus granulosus]|uniref:Uncharacterized protein n=1 Tax=Echinococcus granulosus TaxID=6210 RepID=W6UTK7_ECHGR|nr:hypothetical protein EGR_01104 [Echinococcus granulosus]EUB63976.1 hypothetical protein EGR_01104 [Echinococcus granulosus]